MISLGMNGVSALKSANDLEELRILASDRKLWKELTNDIYDATKAKLHYNI